MLKWLNDWLGEFAVAGLFAGAGFFLKLNSRVTSLEEARKETAENCARIEKLETLTQRHEVMLNTVDTLHEELKACLPQISDLANLSTRLQEILNGMNRRLELVENELISNRKR